MAGRLALWLTGLALGVCALVIVRAEPGFSFAGRSSGGTVMLLAAGWTATTVGLLHSMLRPGNRTGLLLVLAGFTWFLAEWGNPGTTSAAVFSVGLLTYVVCPAAVAHAALAYPTGRLPGRWERRVVAAGYLVLLGVLGLGTALFLDPRSHGCPDCPRNLLAVVDAPERSAAVGIWGVRLGLAWALAALLVLLVQAVTRRSARRGATAVVRAAGAGFLAATAWAFTTALGKSFVGSTALDARLWRIKAVCLVLLGATVAWGLVRSRQRHRELARLVVDLDQVSAPGGMRDALAERLGDPRLQIGYRLDDGRLVEASAAPLIVPTGLGRAATTIPLDGRAEAVLVHRAGLLDDPDLLDRLASGARLGLENERLGAQALTQLSDIRASRTRIVLAADQERHRLERDLHDGAQQRLVGLSLALRLLRNRTGMDDPRLAAAEEELRGAVADLRSLASGLSPAVLRDEGLAAALGALAETRPLRFEVPPDRLPDAVETTAYLVVARATEAGPTWARVETDGRCLTVRATITGCRHLPVDDLLDRVGALDGILTVLPGGDGLLLALDLPMPGAA